jgi:hypothetical protein
MTMSQTATATLQTPWDCKWSRFGHAQTTSPKRRSEGLWVCAHVVGARRPIDATECASCPDWEYDPPAVSKGDSSLAPGVTNVRATVVTARCPRLSETEKWIEVGIRIAALTLAIVFAATGFVVLTRPLAVPLTVTLWGGAVTSFLFGVWGNFNRVPLPAKSW